MLLADDACVYVTERHERRAVNSLLELWNTKINKGKTTEELQSLMMCYN
jgi:hypothetical protein